ncbi:MAG TPA: hypothetical protein VN999_11265, partial [Thermoanaerobaculia bacterium]|nr:hypothetical protein [Thermoanaerobaculia bacterium]
RDVARDMARFWALEWARDWPREWARDFAAHLSLDPIPDWLEEFAIVELFSYGRPSGRVFLSHLEVEPTDGLLALLAHGCRLSLQPEDRSDLVIPKSGEPLDPLWPALARHLARRSTDRDRELLIDLAHHPEKREPPLRWGLQFIVRGDLMLDDGSFLTLDELAAEAGIEPLPYLDEMEPELEVDWDAEI